MIVLDPKLEWPVLKICQMNMDVGDGSCCKSSQKMPESTDCPK